jgi:hypothetical protein
VVTQGIQEWTVPLAGTYRIKTYGASSKNNTNIVGEGAIMQADFNLSINQKLYIAVGQRSVHNGTNAWQGGAGGTFVATGNSLTSSTPLIVSGGGGSSNLSGFIKRANTGTSGKDGSSAGGTNGNQAAGGGQNQDPSGGGAAGFYGNGAPKGDLRGGGPYAGAASFINGAAGGEFLTSYDINSLHGGFGGGGPGGWNGDGGGGGYSGGGNGYTSQTSAGGGGSFISSIATNVYTSDGTFTRTGSEPTTAYSGSVANLGTWWNGIQGKVEITRV